MRLNYVQVHLLFFTLSKADKTLLSKTVSKFLRFSKDGKFNDWMYKKKEASNV